MGNHRAARRRLLRAGAALHRTRSVLEDAGTSPGTASAAMLGLAPESGNQTLGTAIFTYDDSVFVGFKVDTGVISQPEELLASFLTEIDALRDLAGVG